jgi:hypothetical protein
MYTRASCDTVEHNDPFQLVAVEICEPPQDGAPGAWYQYTIRQGNNVITCLRQGSSTAVTDAATQVVAALNARRADRRCRVHIVLKSVKSRSEQSGASSI